MWCTPSAQLYSVHSHVDTERCAANAFWCALRPHWITLPSAKLLTRCVAPGEKSGPVPPHVRDTNKTTPSKWRPSVFYGASDTPRAPDDVVAHFELSPPRRPRLP